MDLFPPELPTFLPVGAALYVIFLVAQARIELAEAAGVGEAAPSSQA